MPSTYVDPVAVFEAREAEMMALASASQPASPAALAAASASNLDINSAIRSIEGSMVGGNVPAVSSYDAGHTLDGSSGVVASARSQAGGFSRMADELQPTDIVTVPGRGEMTVKGAVSLGFIAKDAGGTYRDTDAAPKPAEQSPETAPVLEPERFDQDYESYFTVVENYTSRGTQVAAMNDVINSAVISRVTVERAASELAVPPHEAEVIINAVADAFDRQARDAIGKLGVTDVDAFVAWAGQNRTSDFRQAMQQHYLQRSTAGYRDVVRAFQVARGDKSLGAKPGQKFANGVTTSKSPDGKVVVNIPGWGTTDYATAARMGLVNS